MPTFCAHIGETRLTTENKCPLGMPIFLQNNIVPRTRHYIFVKIELLLCVAGGPIISKTPRAFGADGGFHDFFHADFK